MGTYFQQQIPTQLPPRSHHSGLLSVSSVPVHGNNSGSGSLNIEGNSIWPCFSERTWQGPSHVNSRWRSDFIGACVSCYDAASFLTLFLPCCWMSEPLPRPAEGPGRPWVGDVRGTLCWHVQSWNQEVVVCSQMLTDLDLVGGRREVERRPEAGRGRRCQGRPPAWGLPEEAKDGGISHLNKM